MASISSLRNALSESDGKIGDLLYTLSRAPDAEYRTGRIPGTQARYTLRVWYRKQSGTAECLVTFLFPNQAASVSGPFPIETIATQYRVDSEEGSAIHRMIDMAKSAHYQSVMATI